MRWRMGRIICFVVGHRRSRRRAKATGQGLRSRCSFCGAPMIRLGKDDWRLFDAHEHAGTIHDFPE